MMTLLQANFIRARFHCVDGWEEFSCLEPQFARALDALPDESLIDKTNVFCLEMYETAKREAERFYPFSIDEASENLAEILGGIADDIEHKVANGAQFDSQVGEFVKNGQVIKD